MKYLKHQLLVLGMLSAISVPSIAAGPDRNQIQRAMQVKALGKKQRTREEIRARRAGRKAK